MQETEPASTCSGFRLRFGKFCSTNLCSTNLLCIFFSVVIGLGCSAFALSSYGSGGVSELLDSVFGLGPGEGNGFQSLSESVG